MSDCPVNFLYIGGDKCGSTWMHHVLSYHPDVTLARAKELFYFDRFYDKGAQWYARQFPAERTARVGEICHDYLYSKTALRRIARDLPDEARFLITVRDPMDRTVSHYKYLRKIGRTADPLEAALSAQPQIIEHSLFGKYVALAQNLLGAERVHVLRFEDLRRDPDAFGAQLSAALDIRFLPDLPYADRILEAGAARNPGLVRVLRSAGWGFRHLGAPALVSRIKGNSLTHRLLFKTAPLKSAEVDLPADSVQRLRELFAPDQALLGERVPGLALGLA